MKKKICSWAKCKDISSSFFFFKVQNCNISFLIWKLDIFPFLSKGLLLFPELFQYGLLIVFRFLLVFNFKIHDFWHCAFCFYCEIVGKKTTNSFFDSRQPMRIFVRTTI